MQFWQDVNGVTSLLFVTPSVTILSYVSKQQAGEGDKKKMNKNKIVAFGIIAIFSLAGLTNVSATQLVRPSTTNLSGEEVLNPMESDFLGFGILSVTGGKGSASQLNVFPIFNIALFVHETTAGTITYTTIEGTETYSPSESQPYLVYANILFGYTSWFGPKCQQETFSAGGLAFNVLIREL